MVCARCCWIPSAIAVGIVEDLLIRGIVFRIAEESLGTWIALAISAVLFGVLHAFNTGATAWSTIAIALEARVLLAVAYVVSRGLWLPIGLHIGWNFSEGDVFGAAVSCHPGRGLWSSAFVGPQWLLLWWSTRAGRIVEPHWRAAAGT